MRGGIEAIYDDMPVPSGLPQFAPGKPAVGAMFSARKRAKFGGDPPLPAPVSEDQA
jgi:hypothetical protein